MVNFDDKGKSQFIRQLEAIAENKDFVGLKQPEKETLNQQHVEAVCELQELISRLVEKNEPQAAKSQQFNDSSKHSNSKSKDYQQMQEVMSKGTEFLIGMLKMSTGKELGTQGETVIKVDDESGEISITLQLILN